MIKSIHFITTLCFVFTTTILTAQTSTNGKFSMSAGVGVVPTYLADDASVNTPPVNFRLTYDVSPAFRLSGYVGYSSSTSASPFIISDGQQTLVTNKQTLIGLRGELKKNVSKKFDVYGGALFGYNKHNINEFDQFSGESINREPGTPTPYNPNGPDGEFLYSAFVGSTYYVHKGIGLFAEIGYGVSLLNTGITIRI